MLSHPSSLNRPHPPVKDFPFSVIGKVFDIHGLSCLFLSPCLSSLNFPVLGLYPGGPSIPQFFRIGSGHQARHRPLATYIYPANQLRAGVGFRGF